MAFSCNVFEQQHKYLRDTYLVMKAFIGFGFIRGYNNRTLRNTFYLTFPTDNVLHNSTYLGKGYKYTFLVLIIDYIDLKF